MKKKLSLFTLFLVMPFVIFGAIQIWWYSQAPHATSVNDTDIMLVERPVPHTNLWFNMAQLKSYTSTGITNLTVSNAYITNIYVITGAVDNITVTNGITNLSLTANTVLKADANKRITSIPNGTGALTNDGAGNFGWNTTINGASGPWTNNTDFTWLSGFTMATNGAAQTAPFSIWTNASFFVGPDVFQDIAQDPNTTHFPYAVLMTDSNGPVALQSSFVVLDSESGSAFSRWFSTVSASQSSATYENSIHNDKLSWHMQGASDFDFSTNTVSIFHINNDGLTTANGYIDGSGNIGDLVAYGPSKRLIATNVLNLLTNVATGAQVLTNDGTYVHLVGTVTNVSSPWELANDGELLIGTNVFLGGLAPGFHVFGAVSMTDSNQPAFQFFDMVVTDDVLRKNYGIISGASTGSSASWSLFSGTDGASTNTVVIASQSGHAPFTFTVDATNRAILPYTGVWDSQGYVDESGIDGQFVSYASGKRLTPTLNGGALTNINNLSQSLSNYISSITNSLGGGTVTSVGAAGPAGFTWSAAITTSGTLTATTPGLVLTNGESQAAVFSNSVSINAGGSSNWVSTLVVSNLTASAMVASDANKYLVSVANASGALTNNGSGAIGYYNSFATQPGNNIFSGSNYVNGVVATSTNSCNGIPDFSVLESVFSTNNAPILGAPTSSDSTDKSVQWLLVNLVNTTASVLPIVQQGNVHVVGTAYCTNITACWYQKYGNHFTNVFFIPVY